MKLCSTLIAITLLAISVRADEPTTRPRDTVVSIRIFELANRSQDRVEHAMKVIESNHDLREAVDAAAEVLGMSSDDARKCVSLTLRDAARAEVVLRVDLTRVPAPSKLLSAK